MPTLNKKLLRAKNSTHEMLVMVSFNPDNRAVLVTNETGEIEHTIVSDVERHGMLTIRTTQNRELFSIFYGNPR